MRRLKTRRQFEVLLAASVVSKSNHFKLHRLDITTLQSTESSNLFAVGEIYLGAMTPKRWAKNAVTRNAVKRQIYAACDRFKTPANNLAYLVRLWRTFDRNSYKSASSTLLTAAVKLELESLLSVYLSNTRLHERPLESVANL